MRWRLLLRLLVVAVCVAGLAWAIHALGPRQVLDAALRADPWWLGLSLLPVVARFLVWGHKWRRMLARREPVPLVLAVRILAAGSFVNLTTPTAKLAGGFVRAALLRRHRGWGLATAYGWAVADQITNVLGHLLLFGLLAVGAGFVLPWDGPGRWLLPAGVLVLVGLGTLAGLRGFGWRLLQRSDVGERLERLLPRRLRPANGDEREGPVQRVLSPLLHEGGALDAFLPDLAWAALSFSLLCVAGAMVLRSLGAEASLLEISVAVVLSYFAGVAVGAWGGIGVTEAALTALYVQLGIPVEMAAAGALLHRATFYLVVIAWGGTALLREGRGRTGLARESDGDATRR